MISLNDQISRFQKLCFSSQLNSFIPIDEQFTDKPMTIQSLLTENGFIINQMKQLNQVIQNYCALNHKVYTRIADHELTLHAESNRLNEIGAAADRKINDSINQVKRVYQQVSATCMALQASVEGRTKLVGDAVKGKASQQQLDKLIKRLKKEFGDDFNDERVDTKQGNQIDSKETKQTIKRPKYATISELESIRNQNIAKFEQIRLQSSNSKKNIEKQSESFSRLNSQFKGFLATFEDHSSDFRGLTRNFQQHQMKVNGQIDGIGRRFELIEGYCLKRDDYQADIEDRTASITKKIENETAQVKKQLNNGQAMLNNIIQQLNAKLQSQRKNISQLTLDLTNLKVLQDTHFQSVTEKVSKVDSERKQNELIFDKQIKGVQQQLIANSQQYKSQFKTIDQRIEGFKSEVKAEVVRALQRDLLKHLSHLSDEICERKRQELRFKSQIKVMSQQINNFKEVLCKKANYTDIVPQSEVKAHRDEFQALKVMLHTGVAREDFVEVVTLPTERLKPAHRTPFESQCHSPTYFRSNSQSEQERRQKVKGATLKQQVGLTRPETGRPRKKTCLRTPSRICERTMDTIYGMDGKARHHSISNQDSGRNSMPATRQGSSFQLKLDQSETKGSSRRRLWLFGDDNQIKKSVKTVLNVNTVDLFR